MSVLGHDAVRLAEEPSTALLPSASIVVSTYNRLPYLKRLLDSLSHLESDDFELIIVNGPSTDGTTQFLTSWPQPAKRIACPVANLSVSRNLGVAATTGDIVVFIDDDAMPESAAWLEAYREFFAHRQNANCGAVGGSVLNAITGKTEFYRGSTSEFAEQSRQDGSVFRPPSGGWVVPGVMGCNFAIRTAALRQIGGFDERISYYLDETDVCFRLYDAGYEVAYLPENWVLHASALSAGRVSAAHRDWRTLFRSDTYFCLKNSRVSLPRKLLRIAQTARSKHFFYVIGQSEKRRGMGRRLAVRGWALSLLGIAEGLLSGLSPRRLSRPPQAVPKRVPFRANKPRRKLRVGLVSRTLPGGGTYGGPGQHTDALAKGLYGIGHEVHVFSRPDNALAIGGVEFTVHSRPLSVDANLSYDPELPSTSIRLAAAVDYRRAIETLEAEGKPLDIIIGCNWDLEVLGVIRARTCPVALYLVTPLAMNLELGTFESRDDTFLWNSLDRWQAEHADLKCLPSVATFDIYEELLGLPRDQLAPSAVVPLGIERTHLPPLAIPGRKRLLFVGRLEKRKGVQTLLKALPRILNAFPDWECHFVGTDDLPYEGGPPIKQRFLREHRRAPWRRRVIFHGYCDARRLHDQYRSCDLFVVPALYESFGLAYHEAMQYGKAVIGCRAGGMPESVREGVEGLLVEPDQVAGLIEALTELMGDDARRAAMGQAGAARIAHRDNHETFARRMEAVLLSHLDAHSAHSPDAAEDA